MIRNANRNDIERCAYIESLCFPQAEAATFQSFENRINSYPETFWVLEKDGIIICFINGMYSNEKDLKDEMYENNALYDRNGCWLMIFGVDTHPDYQHKGYATSLMKYVQSHTSETCKGIVLTCKESMISFYAQFGFVYEGVSPSVHGNVIWYQMRYEK
ncbi:MAG: GNAT family N-acetyltransferase [Holdemanella sp.]|nr:GNAT family N-acetyltransferase [Holdemanella sp.]